MSHVQTDHQDQNWARAGAPKAHAWGPAGPSSTTTDNNRFVAHPPLANRGGDSQQTTNNDPISTRYPYVEPGRELLWKGVDFFGATVPPGIAASLVDHMVQCTDGKALRGFERSAEYLCPGGKLWRRWEPVTASPRWGKAYEYLEAAASPSEWLAERLAASVSEIRSTRLDLATDWIADGCPAPVDLVRQFADHNNRTRNGVVCHVRGGGPDWKHTWYVGAPGAERRLRIYRKDVEDPGLYFEPDPDGEYRQGVAIMRVELELRTPHAHPMYELWSAGEPATWSAFGRHFFDLTGATLPLPVGDIPPVERRSNVEAIQTLFHLFRSYAPQLDTMYEVGFDVGEIARFVAEKPQDRSNAKRRKRWKRSLQAAIDTHGIEGLQEYLRTMLLRGVNP